MKMVLVSPVQVSSVSEQALLARREVRKGGNLLPELSIVVIMLGIFEEIFVTDYPAHFLWYVNLHSPKGEVL